MTKPENQSMEALLEKAAKQFSENLPFVIYKKPDSSKVAAFFQRDAKLYLVDDFKEKGYVFAPFEGDSMILIPENQSQVMVADFMAADQKTPENKIPSEPAAFKNEHVQLVQNAVNAIKTGDFDKLVISRKETVDIRNFNFIKTFVRLAEFYPAAFSYCFFHPGTGMWLGAFSELLLKTDGDKLFTMAVAGTQKWHDNHKITWQEKEKKEQEMVTDFIVENLKKIANKIEVTAPYTLKAANLAHIKTDIKATFKTNPDLRETIAILHPTPAVCGLPKNKAKNYIIENEGYNREYYSGFHGELNLDIIANKNNTDLYVNLRCMKIEMMPNKIDAKASLYIGGGITKDSIPENEWIETVNKSQTMKKVLF